MSISYRVVLDPKWQHSSLPQGFLAQHRGPLADSPYHLHHATVVRPTYPVWSEVVGIAGRSSSHRVGKSVSVEMAELNCPVTRGLSSWKMADEACEMVNPGATRPS